MSNKVYLKQTKLENDEVFESHTQLADLLRKEGIFKDYFRIRYLLYKHRPYKKGNITIHRIPLFHGKRK